ncbi:MAG: PaaI family thioesterase [Nitrososphaerales archaeon]|jgi:uncharacterized protein (TIGR00369 family)
MKKSASRGGASEGSVLERIRRDLAEGWTPPVAELVGFRLTKIERGTAAIELKASRRHENPMGTLHGGIICDIADAAMGMSYASLLRADETFTTIELKVNFLRPFWSGRLVARGKVIRKGRTMGLVECRVTDDRRRLVAFATSTCLTLQGKTQGLTRKRKHPTD